MCKPDIYFQKEVKVQYLRYINKLQKNLTEVKQKGKTMLLHPHEGTPICLLVS